MFKGFENRKFFMLMLLYVICTTLINFCGIIKVAWFLVEEAIHVSNFLLNILERSYYRNVD